MDSVPSLSPIACHITLNSLLPCSHDTDGVIRAYKHLIGIIPPHGCGQTCYQDTETAPSRRRAPECHTNPLCHYPRTPTALFWLNWTTAVPVQLNTNSPDPTPTLCLAGLYCTAFGYRPRPLNTIHSVIFPACYPDRQASLYS
jgi:hypothetical protein